MTGLQVGLKVVSSQLLGGTCADSGQLQASQPTEVAATDSTVDLVAGTPFHIQIDGRTTTDIQIYINGANVLPASVFKLNAGTGPLKALFHLEKSANDTAGKVTLHKMEVRLTADVEA